MTEPDRGVARRIIRTRQFPGSRALVGALLVTVAAVGIFAAYAGADAQPDGRFVVARHDLPPGATLTADDVSVEVGDLAPELVGHTYSSSEELDGAVSLAPIRAGELVQRSAVVDAATDPSAGRSAEPAHEFSFAIERERAVNGDLRPGERVDVLATYGTGETASTVVVTAGALVIEVTEGTTAIGSSGTVVLTIAVGQPADVLALAHATDAASVTVVRSTRAGDEDLPTERYQPPVAVGAAAPR